jgi:ATPase family associated with various cellular activities (AAA)
MSLAGKRSTQGDEYQLRVALHWLIRMLEDDSIHGIQVDSTGIPGQDFSITVDDVVVLYKDGRACFIQAKKNQTDHEAWSLTDEVLKKELKKACEQLEIKENSEVKFYSRSPFGELKALVDTCKAFPDYASFLRDQDQKQIAVLKRLANVMERSDAVTFDLTRRISFGPTDEFEDWDRRNLQDLDRIVPRADLVMPILERYLSSHEATLRSSKDIITREDLLTELAKRGLSPTPQRSEAEILAIFKLASGIGRHWLCTIDGEKIPRVELNRLIELIEQGSQTILLTDRPGSGKTCLLLDLADEIEKADSRYGLLFIKGDQFTEVNSEQDLVAKKLPEDIVGQCARLAGFRHVVVVIDSLDVLSLSRHHSSLKVFLGLMDQLEKVKNVTTIAACHNFDLQYDPLLRGRSWQQTVHLQPLDFETIVKPFLVGHLA